MTKIATALFSGTVPMRASSGSSRRTRWFASAAVTTTLSGLFFVAPSYAASTNWTNVTADSNWFNAANWSAGVPTAADTATLALPGGLGPPHVANVNAAGAVAANVNIQNNNFISVNSGGVLNVSGTVEVGHAATGMPDLFHVTTGG